jgi:ATP-binding cassette subfamily C (CFTR/MRP) protein 1
MVRGSLVTAIYRKTTGLSAVNLDNASALTLMSADVERITDGLAMLHSLWSLMLQISISLYLLYRVAQAAFVVPLGMFIGIVVYSLSGHLRVPGPMLTH